MGTIIPSFRPMGGDSCLKCKQNVISVGRTSSARLTGRGGYPKKKGNNIGNTSLRIGEQYLDSQGNFAPAKAGFNLADVSSVEELNALPPGVKGLVWLDQGDGVTQSFIDAVTPYIGNPNVYGFFLKDEPRPDR